MIELDEIMCQRGDTAFAELLVESELLLVLMKTMLYLSLEWYHLTALTIPVKHYMCID